MISPHHRTHLLFCVIKENSAGFITSLCFLSSSLAKAPDTLILMIGALGKYDFDVLGSSEVRVRHLGDHWLTLQGPQFSDFILEKQFGLWISFETSDMCIVCGPWPTFWPRIEDTWTIFWAHTEIMFYIPCNPNHVIETYSVLFSFPKCVILEAPVRVQRHLELRLFLMQKYVIVSGSKKSGLWPFTSITRTTHNLHAKYNGSYALPKIHPLNINWFWNQNWPQMPGLLTSLFIQRAKRKISRTTKKLGGTASSPTTREEIALKHCW